MCSPSAPHAPPPLPAFQRRVTHRPAVVRSGGPERIYDQAAADPGYEPPRIRGFGIAVEAVTTELLQQVAGIAALDGIDGDEVHQRLRIMLDLEQEPLLWDGDQA